MGRIPLPHRRQNIPKTTFKKIEKLTYLLEIESKYLKLKINQFI
jgi:hypothetical protein